MWSLAIVGGGGFRVPLIVSALASHRLPLAKLILIDPDPARLAVMRAIVADQLQQTPGYQPEVVTTADEAALGDADIIFVAMRIGGVHGRVSDELIALSHGLLGQETVGIGGMAYALRTLPAARRLAATIARLAPHAWTINFTNPAGVITEAMAQILGGRVVGICDTPIALLSRASNALGLAQVPSDFDYLGLNHLGWLRALHHGGKDQLPALLADAAKLATMEETELFGTDLIRTIGAIPNEYLFYYYCHREALAGIRREQTRGEFLAAQQTEFYTACCNSATPYRLWDETRRSRDASYMAEARAADQKDARAASEIEQGGYHNVAVELMGALLEGRNATMILNVSNNASGTPVIAGLPADATVEVGCRVDKNGAKPIAIAPAPGDMLALMQAIKACDRLLLAASENGDPRLAERAFITHPLVDSARAASAAFADYCAANPQLFSRD